MFKNCGCLRGSNYCHIAAHGKIYTCQDRSIQTNNGPPTCSLTVIGRGACTGQDQLPLVDTNAPGKGWEEPWEPYPILFKAVSILILQEPQDLGTPTVFRYIFAGNSYTPDIMAEFGAYATSQIVQIPGNGMPFPAQGQQTWPGGNHIDLHVNCVGGSYQ